MNLSITTNNTYTQSIKPNNNKANLTQPNFKSNPILKEATKKAMEFADKQSEILEILASENKIIADEKEAFLEKGKLI